MDDDVPTFNTPRNSFSESPPEKPKWVTSKTNAIKEIEEWATDSLSEGLTHELARTCGQLPDNVTEARMLKAKIYELSKERYKFKAQTDFEKKMFLDRQQRKTAYLKDLLRGVSMDVTPRRQSWTAPPSHSSARMSFLNRMDVSRCSDRPKEVLEAEEQILREQEEKLSQRAKVRMPLIKSASATTGERRRKKGAKSATCKWSTATPLHYSTDPSIRQGDTSHAVNQKLPDVKLDPSGTIPMVQATPHESKSLTEAHSSGPPVRQNLLRKREDERSKTRVQFAEAPATRASSSKKRKGPVNDSRFYSLTNALSGVYTCDKPQDISTIVRSIESLHTKPKHPQDARPKVTKKIKEFMRSRGIVF